MKYVSFLKELRVVEKQLGSGFLRDSLDQLGHVLCVCVCVCVCVGGGGGGGRGGVK